MLCVYIVTSGQVLTLYTLSVLYQNCTVHSSYVKYDIMVESEAKLRMSVDIIEVNVACTIKEAIDTF